MYISVAFSTFTRLWNHRPYLVPELFHHPAQNPIPIKQALAFLLPASPWRALICCLSLALPVLDVSHARNRASPLSDPSSFTQRACPCLAPLGAGLDLPETVRDWLAGGTSTLVRVWSRTEVQRGWVLGVVDVRKASWRSWFSFPCPCGRVPGSRGAPSSGARHVLGVFVRMAQRAHGASLLRAPHQLEASASAPGPWLAQAARQRAQRRGTRTPGPAPHLPGVSVRNARGKRTFIEHLLGAGAGLGGQGRRRPGLCRRRRLVVSEPDFRADALTACGARPVLWAHPARVPQACRGLGVSPPRRQRADGLGQVSRQCNRRQEKQLGAAAGGKALDVRPSAPAHVICVLPGLSLGWEHILSWTLRVSSELLGVPLAGGTQPCVRGERAGGLALRS